ncbi:hypothetical protein GGS24DRAFT_208702 [Hypoxylon argillaceum]|nr:hypothetical protein GGS24DRAFT_208702 [Hypoxylon argillaceum]
MQVIDNQTETDKQHAIYSLISNSAGNFPFQDPIVADHNIWGASEPEWHLNGIPIIDQQTADYVGYSRAQSSTVANSIEYYSATNCHILPEEWSSNLALDAACDKYGTAPFVTTVFPPTAQNFVTQPETLESPYKMEKGDESSSPMSSSPHNGPKTRTKRTRNRLAAAKCRKKAKRGVDELQQKEQDLLRENKMLSAEAGLLREEVLQLKCEILRHSACDNDYIRHYIQNAAGQIGKAPHEMSTCGISPVLAPS